MTARTLLGRRVYWIMAASYAGFGLLITGILLGGVLGQPVVTIVALAGFAVAFLTSMFAYYIGLRCPRCWGNLGPLVMHRGGFGVDRQLQFCPYCGVRLDDELPEKEAGVDDSA